MPSFDVTTLFNGLEPVLRQLSPEELNKFTGSLYAVLEGTGNGIGPALAAIEQQRQKLPPDARILGFNYDTGERYLSVPDFLPLEE